MVYYEAYCDETGDDGGFPILAVGGYLIRPSNARKLNAEWMAVLRRYQIPYFHMVELAHGNGVFENMAKERREQLQKELFKLINARVEIAFALAVPLRRFSKEVNDGQDPYTLCLNHGHTCLESLLKQKHGDSYRLSVYYEAGHKHASQAKQRFQDSKFAGKRPDFAFIGKQDSGVVQAADALVWQYGKFIKDLAQSTRGVRKDFQYLMKKPSMFVNVVPDKEAYVMFSIYDEHLNGIDQTISHLASVRRDLNVLREIYSQKLSLRELADLSGYIVA